MSSQDSLLIIGLATLISFGQERPTTESTPNVKPEALGPGDHTRTLMMGEKERTYQVHVPKDYDPKKPAPVVLALHGAAMDGSMMVWFSGLNKKSDESGFIVVYPSGSGVGPFRTWNAGGFTGKMAEGKADDVAFTGKLLNDLGTVVKVDEKRVYAWNHQFPPGKPSSNGVLFAQGCRSPIAASRLPASDSRGSKSGLPDDFGSRFR